MPIYIYEFNLQFLWVLIKRSNRFQCYLVMVCFDNIYIYCKHIQHIINSNYRRWPIFRIFTGFSKVAEYHINCLCTELSSLLYIQSSWSIDQTDWSSWQKWSWNNIRKNWNQASLLIFSSTGPKRLNEVLPWLCLPSVNHMFSLFLRNCQTKWK